jgi:hypothetical protein
MLRRAKARAKLKGLPCTVTKEWLARRLVKGRCQLSGLPFRTGQSRNKTYSASLHRINSSKGYTPANCLVILNALNNGIGNWGLRAASRMWRRVLQ